MYERFTDRARKVMQLANQEAQRFNHEYIGTEHVLLGLVKEGSGVAATVLKEITELRAIRLEVERRVMSGPEMITMGRLPQTPQAKKVIEYSMEEARTLNHQFVGTEHLLLGLLRVDKGIAAEALEKLAVDFQSTRKQIMHHLGYHDYKEGEEEQQSPQSSQVGKMNNRALHALSLARNFARQMNCCKLDTHHLLVGILKQQNNDAAFALRLSGLTVEKAEQISAKFSRDDQADVDSPSNHFHLTDDLAMALTQAESLSKKVLNAELLAMGLLQPPADDNIVFKSTKLLQELGIDPKMVAATLASYMSPDPNQRLRTYVQSQNSNPFEKNSANSKPDPVLAAVGRNLTLNASFSCDVPVEVDEPTMERMFSVLLRRNRNNILLVGSPEKCRAYLDTLAFRATNSDAPYAFDDDQIYEVALVDLIHDPKFEAKFVKALNAVRRQKGHILAVPGMLDLHKFDSPFREQYSFLDSLHPWLVLPGFRMIGTIQPDEIENLKSLPHIVSQFEVLRLDTVELPSSIGMIKQSVSKLEDHHLCVYSNESVSVASRLIESLKTDKDWVESHIERTLNLLDEAGVVSGLRAEMGQLDSKQQEEIRALDRELRNINCMKQTSFEEANFKAMWQFDFRFDELMRQRVKILPLHEVNQQGVIETFAKQFKLNVEEVKSRLV